MITSEKGDRLQALLDVGAEVSWTEYANADLQFLVEPLLHSALKRHGLLGCAE